MAHFSRLIFAVLLCLTFNMSANAADIVPNGPAGCPPDPDPGFTTSYDSDPAFTGSRSCRVGVNGPGTATWGNLYQCTAFSFCPFFSPSHIVSTVPTCPADSTLNTSGQCECIPGYTADGDTCKPPAPNCAENQELDIESNTCVCKQGPAGSFAVSGDVYLGCNNGCSIVLSSGSYSKDKNKTYGNWKQNGSTCAPSGTSPEPDPSTSPDGQDAGKCPTGQCPGTFNGQFMCVPCKGKESSDSSSSENTTETPSGASAPSGSASQSQSGSKSTECEGGVCTTKETVVTTNPDGSTTEKQNETTESISDYCAKNPKAAICKAEDAGQWGGACGDGFQCTGDPVQCAQAREVAKLRCVFDVSPDDPLAVAGGLAMNGELTPSGHPGAPGSGVTVNVMEKIDTAPAFGSSGNCISDRTFSVVGMSLTLPFASMCPYFNMIGNVFLSCCYLVAGFIVFRR